MIGPPGGITGENALPDIPFAASRDVSFAGEDYISREEDVECANEQNGNTQIEGTPNKEQRLSNTDPASKRVSNEVEIFSREGSIVDASSSKNEEVEKDDFVLTQSNNGDKSRRDTGVRHEEGRQDSGPPCRDDSGGGRDDSVVVEEDENGIFDDSKRGNNHIVPVDEDFPVVSPSAATAQNSDIIAAANVDNNSVTPPVTSNDVLPSTDTDDHDTNGITSDDANHDKVDTERAMLTPRRSDNKSQDDAQSPTVLISPVKTGEAEALLNSSPEKDDTRNTSDVGSNTDAAALPTDVPVVKKSSRNIKTAASRSNGRLDDTSITKTDSVVELHESGIIARDRSSSSRISVVLGDLENYQDTLARIADENQDTIRRNSREPATEADIEAPHQQQSTDQPGSNDKCVDGLGNDDGILGEVSNDPAISGLDDLINDAGCSNDQQVDDASKFRRGTTTNLTSPIFAKRATSTMNNNDEEANAAELIKKSKKLLKKLSQSTSNLEADGGARNFSLKKRKSNTPSDEESTKKDLLGNLKKLKTLKKQVSAESSSIWAKQLKKLKKSCSGLDVNNKRNSDQKSAAASSKNDEHDDSSDDTSSENSSRSSNIGKNYDLSSSSSNANAEEPNSDGAASLSNSSDDDAGPDGFKKVHVAFLQPPVANDQDTESLMESGYQYSDSLSNPKTSPKTLNSSANLSARGSPISGQKNPKRSPVQKNSNLDTITDGDFEKSGSTLVIANYLDQDPRKTEFDGTVNDGLSSSNIEGKVTRTPVDLFPNRKRSDRSSNTNELSEKISSTKKSLKRGSTRSSSKKSTTNSTKNPYHLKTSRSSLGDGLGNEESESLRAEKSRELWREAKASLKHGKTNSKATDEHDYGRPIKEFYVAPVVDDDPMSPGKDSRSSAMSPLTTTPEQTSGSTKLHVNMSQSCVLQKFGRKGAGLDKDSNDIDMPIDDEQRGSKSDNDLPEEEDDAPAREETSGPKQELNHNLSELQQKLNLKKSRTTATEVNDNKFRKSATAPNTAANTPNGKTTSQARFENIALKHVTSDNHDDTTKSGPRTPEFFPSKTRLRSTASTTKKLSNLENKPMYSVNSGRNELLERLEQMRANRAKRQTQPVGVSVNELREEQQDHDKSCIQRAVSADGDSKSDGGKVESELGPTGVAPTDDDVGGVEDGAGVVQDSDAQQQAKLQEEKLSEDEVERPSREENIEKRRVSARNSIEKSQETEDEQQENDENSDRPPATGIVVTSDETYKNNIFREKMRKFPDRKNFGRTVTTSRDDDDQNVQNDQTENALVADQAENENAPADDLPGDDATTARNPPPENADLKKSGSSPASSFRSTPDDLKSDIPTAENHQEPNNDSGQDTTKMSDSEPLTGTGPLKGTVTDRKKLFEKPAEQNDEKTISAANREARADTNDSPKSEYGSKLSRVNSNGSAVISPEKFISPERGVIGSENFSPNFIRGLPRPHRLKPENKDGALPEPPASAGAIDKDSDADETDESIPGEKQEDSIPDATSASTATQPVRNLSSTAVPIPPQLRNHLHGLDTAISTRLETVKESDRSTRTSATTPVASLQGGAINAGNSPKSSAEANSITNSRRSSLATLGEKNTEQPVNPFKQQQRGGFLKKLVKVAKEGPNEVPDDKGHAAASFSAVNLKPVQKAESTVSADISQPVSNFGKTRSNIASITTDALATNSGGANATVSSKSNQEKRVCDFYHRSNSSGLYLDPNGTGSAAAAPTTSEEIESYAGGKDAPQVSETAVDTSATKNVPSVINAKKMSDAMKSRIAAFGGKPTTTITSANSISNKTNATSFQKPAQLNNNTSEKTTRINPEVTISGATPATSAAAVVSTKIVSQQAPKPNVSLRGIMTKNTTTKPPSSNTSSKGSSPRNRGCVDDTLSVLNQVKASLKPPKPPKRSSTSAKFKPVKRMYSSGALVIQDVAEVGVGQQGLQQEEDFGTKSRDTIATVGSNNNTPLQRTKSGSSSSAVHCAKGTPAAISTVESPPTAHATLGRNSVNVGVSQGVLAQGGGATTSSINLANSRCSISSINSATKRLRVSARCSLLSGKWSLTGNIGGSNCLGGAADSAMAAAATVTQSERLSGSGYATKSMKSAGDKKKSQKSDSTAKKVAASVNFGDLSTVKSSKTSSKKLKKKSSKARLAEEDEDDECTIVSATVSPPTAVAKQARGEKLSSNSTAIGQQQSSHDEDFLRSIGVFPVQGSAANVFSSSAAGRPSRDSRRERPPGSSSKKSQKLKSLVVRGVEVLEDGDHGGGKKTSMGKNSASRSVKSVKTLFKKKSRGVISDGDGVDNDDESSSSDDSSDSSSSDDSSDSDSDAESDDEYYFGNITLMTLFGEILFFQFD